MNPSPSNNKKLKRRAKLVRKSKYVAVKDANDIIIVTIPSFEIKQEVLQKPKQINVPLPKGKEFTIPVGGLSTQTFVYNLEFRNKRGVVWSLQRSFGNFRQLDKKIKQRFPQLKSILPRFPRRQLFITKDSPKALHRQNFLQAYLQALLQLKPRMKSVVDFIELKNHSSKKGKDQVDVNDFELCKVLGKGSYGKVFLVRVIGTTDMFAMKVLKKSEVKEKSQVEHTKTELRVMGALSHPFIVKLQYAFQSEANLFLVSDLCEGGELFQKLKQEGIFSAETVQFYGAEISLALNYLHEKEIVYRDLKPENILLDSNGHIKVTDFGLSRDNMKDPVNGATTFCGTPEYIAPEMLRARKLQNGYGFAVDWWAYGTLLYEMFTGLPPFYDENRQQMLKKIMAGRLVVKNKNIPKEGQLLIVGLLNRNPEKRTGFAKISTHPFFTKFGGGIIFDDLLKLRIDPPVRYTERAQGSFINNFDNFFVQQEARLSEDEDYQDQDEDDFGDFSFNRDVEDQFFHS